jgi:energy-coupling factor transporter ATP-binding protein EcfA2
VIALELRGLGYRFPTGSAPALADVDLVVRPGELVLVTGPTGCGKSTLLRLAAGLLQRHGSGERWGSVSVGGEDPVTTPPPRRVGRVGFVSQSPERQIVAGTLGDEVAFALDSAGWSQAEIDPRVLQILERVGLPPEPDRSTSALSGGERQRAVVGAGLAAGAGLLLLDEPLAQLDPPGAARLVALLRSLADDGTAVVLVEHRLPLCLPACDRVVVLENGAIVADAATLDLALGRRLGLALPGLPDLLDRLGGRPPTTPPLAPIAEPGPAVASAERVSWTYAGAQGPALHPTDVSIARGERVALLGANGSGKTTLLRLLTGALRHRGVRRAGRVVDVPQDPDRALFCATVQQELEHGPREARHPDPAAVAAAAARDLSVLDLLHRAPQALSRGQRLRVAVAAALACDPDLLVLDEPTSGQDADQVERMMDALGRRTALFATHDVDLALRHATRVLVLDGGRVVDDGPPVDVARRQAAAGRLVLPELVAWCLERGLPPSTAATLAGEG